jgi:hypothetical protein
MKRKLGGRHAGAFLAIACFAMTCTLLSTLAAGAQTTGSITVPYRTTTPGTPTPTGTTTTAPATGVSPMMPANTTQIARPAPIGTTSCAPPAGSAGCAPGAARPANGMTTPPATAYPLNPPTGNGQPGG